MKLRSSLPLTLTLSLALPAALTESGLGRLPGAERESFAQGAAPPPSDTVTEIARQRYQEGVKAFDAGRYEDARAAFLQAYALKRHPAVLLNIGQSELRSGHYEDAGNHLQQFLREDKGATPDQRGVAEKGIGEAKKRAGFVIVIVDAQGSDVSIDGALVGKAPILDPVFVKPGKHTIFAVYQGKSAATVVDARAGSAATANVVLGVPGAAPATPPPAATPPAATPPPATTAPATTAPATTAPLATAPPPATTPPPAYPPAAGPASGASGGFTLGMMPGAGPAPDQVSSGREPLFHWFKRKPIAWVGVGVTGVGLIMGVTTSIIAGSASSSADDLTNQIAEQQKIRKETGLPVCGDRDTGAGGIAFYDKACSMLRDDISTYNTAMPLAVTGWVLFGVGAIGTAAYAMLDWYPKKSQTTASGPRILAVTPVVSSTQQGIGIAGTF